MGAQTDDQNFNGRIAGFFFFLPHHMACGILVPQPGVEPGPSAVRAWSLNHWTAREFPRIAGI